MNWKLLAFAGLMLLALGAYAAYVTNENGELDAKLERAQADMQALQERERKVTAGLANAHTELKKLKEERDASKDRLNRVADPSGCLDTVLPAAFTDELRRAWGDNRAP